MFRFGPPKYSLGIDIGSSCLKFVMLKKGKSGAEVVACGVETYPDGVFVDGELEDVNTVVSMLKTIKKENNLKFEQVFTSVASQNTILRFLPLPDLEDAELKMVVEGEAEQYVPYSIDEVNLNYAKLARIEMEGSMRVLCLLAVAKKQYVETLVNLFKAVGVKQLDALDIDAIAVINSLDKYLKRKNQAQDFSMGEGEDAPTVEDEEPMGSSLEGMGSDVEDEVVAIVSIGARTTIINVLKDGVLRFSRNVPISGNNITEVIKSVYKVTFQEAEATKIEKSVAAMQGEVDTEFEEVVQTTVEEIAAEIRRSFDYFKAQHREPVIHRVILTGGTAKLKNIDTLLSNELSVDVELGDPSFGLQKAMPNEDLFMDNLHQFSVALGLAMRGVDIDD